METTELHSLSALQERRIVTYIEDKSLEINRAFQKRHMSSSKLQTLPDYISAMRVLIFDLVMLIPPMIPSGELRVSLLLRLTADLLEAAPGYQPFVSSTTGDDSEQEELFSTSGDSEGSEGAVVPHKYPLVELFDMLHDLDNAWAAVLSCQVWNRESKAGEDVILSVDEHESRRDAMEEDSPSISERTTDGSHAINLYAPNPTECTRLRSIILAAMSAIEDWLDEGQVPDVAKEPFEECFDWTLRLLGDGSNAVSWEPIEDEFAGCGAAPK